MTYRFECRCGKKLQAKDEDLGEEVRCPQCGARILLPLTPDGKHGYAGREPFARPALVLGLLPLVMVIYAAIETAISGPGGSPGTVFNIAGTVLWLGQVATVVLASIALKRIKQAQDSGNLLQGAWAATAGLVLGSIWLALFALAAILSLAGL